MNRTVRPMNNLKSLLFGALLALAAGAGAQAQYLGGDLNLSLDEDDDIRFLAGDVTLDGRVGGDVRGIAGDVSIDADIGGDVSIVGADVTLNGLVGGDVDLAGADLLIGSDVDGDVDAAGANVTFTGRIGGSVEAAGALITLEEGAEIAGDAEFAAREVQLLGRIGGSLEARARDLRIHGEIDGPLEIRARNVTFEDGARISGPIEVRGPNEPEIAEGAEIAGEVTYEFAEWDEHQIGEFEGVNFDLDFGPPSWAFGGAFAASAFVLGLLASLMAPKSVAAVAMAFRKRPWISGLLGLVVFAVSPVLVLTLAVLLLATVIGIPLALVVLFAFPVILFLAFAFGGVAIGDMIFNRSGERAGLGLRTGSLALVLLALAALGAVPVLGWIVSLVVLCIGFGAWSMAIFSRQLPEEAASEPAA
ncbi:hypothetical protein DDZ18_05780 [Marinicauda salina]|uniref:DUF8173 domain-containing protein n=2 Tax=Marinicauda salina TaxID=2135793 RepID=A0A2U2BT52_9PROT|nr:hypothetical protein DDZ18_05780 [Marinicauda salina]